MFACLFFGDSLALGTADAVNARLSRPCEVRAVPGAASTAMLGWSLSGSAYDGAIVSIGSNDDIGAPLPGRADGRSSTSAARRRAVRRAITRLRQRLPGCRVVWMLPYDRDRAILVRSIAVRFGDEVLDMERFPTRDRIHPSSYRAVAAALLR